MIIILIETFVLLFKNKKSFQFSKESGCEVLADWIKPCENHLYWSATSTFSGNGKVILGKFKSFLSHIINKHSSLADPVFNKCGHYDIQPKKWLHVGAY